MFTPEMIIDRLRQTPFRPFRIIASEGQRFEIHHPDLVVVGKRDLTILTKSDPNSTGYDRFIRVALIHVVALENLPVSAAPTNGPIT